MRRRLWTAALAMAGAILFVELAGASPRSDDASTKLDLAKTVGRVLSTLPGYDVFDLLTFQVSDTGVVTLDGYVLQASLKDEAEKAVRKIEGVKDVENRIDPLLPGLSRDGTPEGEPGLPRPRLSF